LPEDEIEKVMKQLEDPRQALKYLGHKVDIQKIKRELTKS